MTCSLSSHTPLSKLLVQICFTTLNTSIPGTNEAYKNPMPSTSSVLLHLFLVLDREAKVAMVHFASTFPGQKHAIINPSITFSVLQHEYIRYLAFPRGTPKCYHKSPFYDLRNIFHPAKTHPFIDSCV